MKIPDQFKLMGHIIRVEQVSTKEIDGAGEYRDYYNLIRLRVEDNPESSVAEAFLHEIFEVIKTKNNLDIDHTHLTILSECLFQVLRDNGLNFTEPCQLDGRN